MAHQVDTAFENGWSTLKNGELLDAAQLAGYDLLITTDQNLRYQQNLSNRTISILVLTVTSWPRIQLKIEEIIQSIAETKPGGYQEIQI